MNKIDWCIEQHRKTNHQYDRYLPYEFHLRMVNQAAMDFIHLLDNKLDYFTGEENAGPRGDETVTLRDACLIATWGHDLIEDTRTSYNDVKAVLGREVADIIYAVSNEKGKTRAERANDKYYEGIRNTPGAVFVKLCDRIANVQYSKMTKSSMFKKYKLEQPHFEKMLGRSEDRDDLLEPMFAYLENLFNEL
jgi:(p)ppGpp synthase/HD superfamily hydrolase